jgi:hypothetical protein
MGPRAGLDDMEKEKFLTLPGLELRSPYRPAHSSTFTLSLHNDYESNVITCLLFETSHKRGERFMWYLFFIQWKNGRLINQ